MRNEGGGFAANIYEAMPEDGMQVTSHESLEAIHPYFQTSNFKLHGSGVVCSIPTLKRKSIAIKRGCEEMRIHFFTVPFLLLSFGSRFRVQGSRGGFAAFFRGWYSRIAAFPSRGRCPEGADRVTMV